MSSLRVSAVVSRLITIVAWACFAVVGGMTVGSSVVHDEVFLGTDIMTTIEPWRTSTEATSRPANPNLGDTVDTVAPQTALLIQAARDGYLAEWNPFVVGGAELGGMPNSGAYSPLSLPWWILSADVAPAVVKLLEMVAVAVGMSLLLRRFGTHPASWAIASTVYVYSGFMVAWTNWPQTRVAALIPLLFWTLDRAVSRRSVWDAVPVALVVAAMLLGGFPAVTGYALYFGAAYVLVRTIALRRGPRQAFRAAATASGGVLLGGLISAWQMVPFAYNAMTVIDLTSRAQTPQHHLSWDHLATALVPDILGQPDGSFYWGGANPVERFSYVGVAATVLVAASLFLRSRRKHDRLSHVFAAVSLLLCVLLTYRGGALLALAQHFPVFSNNPVGRLRVMVGFFAAILSAYGFSALVTPQGVARQLSRSSSGRTKALTLTGVAVAGALGIAAILLVRNVTLRAPEFQAVIEGVHRAFVIGLVVGILVVVVWAVPSQYLAAIAGIAVVVLVCYPAINIGNSWWPKNDKRTFYPVTATHQFLDDNLDGQRYVPVGQVMLPGSSSLYQQRSFGGHAFMTPEWKELVTAVDPEGLLSPTYAVLTRGDIESWTANSVLDRFAVTYLVADPMVDILGSVEAAEPAGGSVTLDDGAAASTGQYSGPIRGIRLSFPEPVAPGVGGATLTATVRDEDGLDLASTTNWVNDARGGTWIALAGDEIGSETPWTLELSVHGADASITVPVSSSGLLSPDIVRPVDDDLTVVHTGDSTVYQRATALDRVRWASGELVIEDPAERVSALASGVVSAATVVLEDADDAVTLDGTSRATVAELDSDLNHVVIDVDADGAGWIVVADSFRREGWTATVDGDPVPLVAAEHAGGAVFVDEGTHSVELAYRTPGLTQGVIISLVTMGGVVVACIFWFVGRRRSSSGGADNRHIDPVDMPDEGSFGQSRDNASE